MKANDDVASKPSSGQDDRIFDEKKKKEDEGRTLSPSPVGDVIKESGMSVRNSLTASIWSATSKPMSAASSMKKFNLRSSSVMDLLEDIADDAGGTASITSSVSSHYDGGTDSNRATWAKRSKTADLSSIKGIHGEMGGGHEVTSPSDQFSAGKALSKQGTFQRGASQVFNNVGTPLFGALKRGFTRAGFGEPRDSFTESMGLGTDSWASLTSGGDHPLAHYISRKKTPQKILELWSSTFRVSRTETASIRNVGIHASDRRIREILKDLFKKSKEQRGADMGTILRDTRVQWSYFDIFATQSHSSNSSPDNDNKALTSNSQAPTTQGEGAGSNNFSSKKGSALEKSPSFSGLRSALSGILASPSSSQSALPSDRLSSFKRGRGMWAAGFKKSLKRLVHGLLYGLTLGVYIPDARIFPSGPLIDLYSTGASKLIGAMFFLVYISVWIATWHAVFGTPIEENTEFERRLFSQCLLADKICDIIYLISFLILAFRMSKVNEKGVEIKDSLDLVRMSFSDVYFYCDLISCIGLPLTFGFPGDILVERIGAVAKLLRLWRLMVTLRDVCLDTNFILLLGQRIFTFLLFGHLVGCLWFIVTCTSVESNPTCEIGEASRSGDAATHVHKGVQLLRRGIDGPVEVLMVYTYSLKTGVYVFLGYENQGGGWREDIFLGLITPIGAIVQAWIFSNMITMYQRLTALDTSYIEQANTIEQAMHTLKLPSILKYRILAFNTYRRLHRSAVTFQALFAGLSEQLSFELRLVLYYSLLSEVPIFKNSHARVLRELVCVLHDELFLPGDFVCRYGDAGSEMFFIASGECTVLSKNLDDVLKKLTKGDYFGEVSLITGQARTAYVRADTYCTLASLQKKEFEHIMKAFPKQLEAIIKLMSSSQVSVLMKLGGSSKPPSRCDSRRQSFAPESSHSPALSPNRTIRRTSTYDPQALAKMNGPGGRGHNRSSLLLIPTESEAARPQHRLRRAHSEIAANSRGLTMFKNAGENNGEAPPGSPNGMEEKDFLDYIHRQNSAHGGKGGMDKQDKQDKDFSEEKSPPSSQGIEMAPHHQAGHSNNVRPSVRLMSPTGPDGEKYKLIIPPTVYDDALSSSTERESLAEGEGRRDLDDERGSLSNADDDKNNKSIKKETTDLSAYLPPTLIPHISVSAAGTSTKDRRASHSALPIVIRSVDDDEGNGNDNDGASNDKGRSTLILSIPPFPQFENDEEDEDEDEEEERGKGERKSMKHLQQAGGHKKGIAPPSSPCDPASFSRHETPKSSFLNQARSKISLVGKWRKAARHIAGNKGKDKDNDRRSKGLGSPSEISPLSAKSVMSLMTSQSTDSAAVEGEKKGRRMSRAINSGLLELGDSQGILPPSPSLNPESMANSFKDFKTASIGFHSPNKLTDPQSIEGVKQKSFRPTELFNRLRLAILNEPGKLLLKKVTNNAVVNNPNGTGTGSPRTTMMRSPHSAATIAVNPSQGGPLSGKTGGRKMSIMNLLMGSSPDAGKQQQQQHAIRASAHESSRTNAASSEARESTRLGLSFQRVQRKCMTMPDREVVAPSSHKEEEGTSSDATDEAIYDDRTKDIKDDNLIKKQGRGMDLTAMDDEEDDEESLNESEELLQYTERVSTVMEGMRRASLSDSLRKSAKELKDAKPLKKGGNLKSNQSINIEMARRMMNEGKSSLNDNKKEGGNLNEGSTIHPSAVTSNFSNSPAEVHKIEMIISRLLLETKKRCGEMEKMKISMEKSEKQVSVLEESFDTVTSEFDVMVQVFFDNTLEQLEYINEVTSRTQEEFQTHSQRKRKSVDGREERMVKAINAVSSNLNETKKPEAKGFFRRCTRQGRDLENELNAANAVL